MRSLIVRNLRLSIFVRLTNIMENSKIPESTLHNVAASNIPSQLPHTLNEDNDLWSVAANQLMQEQYLATDYDLWLATLHPSTQQQALATITTEGFSFEPLPNVGFLDTQSEVAQVKWSSDLTMDWTSSASNIDKEPGEYSLDPVVVQNQPDPLSSRPNTFRSNSYPLRPMPQKRKPKAATMTDQRWEPATDRIRHLLVVEEKNYGQIRSIINKEFGFNPT
jgi:hypothetical protein